jgi:hypothetical protein
VRFLLLLPLAACGSDELVWAVHHGSVIPSETALEGTQTWEFFTAAWAKNGSEDEFGCARTQLVVGAVNAALPGCDGCMAAYALTTEEFDTDCSDPLDTDPAFETPLAIGIGDVPDDLADLDPYPGRSLGWYISVDGKNMEPYGFAYDEALDWAGDVGAPGWVAGQTYTLWPAFAWDLRD